VRHTGGEKPKRRGGENISDSRIFLVVVGEGASCRPTKKKKKLLREKRGRVEVAPCPVSPRGKKKGEAGDARSRGKKRQFEKTGRPLPARAFQRRKKSPLAQPFDPILGGKGGKTSLTYFIPGGRRKGEKTGE